MPVIDNTIAVKRFFQNQAATGLNAMMNHTLTVANLTAPFRRRGSLKSRNVEVRRIGRDAIRLTWKPVYSQYQNRGRRANGTHVVRKYTTAGTGKGFVDEGVRSTMKDYKRFFR